VTIIKAITDYDNFSESMGNVKNADLTINKSHYYNNFSESMGM